MQDYRSDMPIKPLERRQILQPNLNHPDGFDDDRRNQLVACRLILGV